MTSEPDLHFQDLYDKIDPPFQNATPFARTGQFYENRSITDFNNTTQMIDQCPFKFSQHLALATIPLFIVGLILTGISIYVYTRPYQLKTTVGFLLAWLSVFEWLFLLASFQVFSISETAFFACPTTENEYPKIKAYSEIYIFPLTHATKYMCVCISIIISIQQWIAVFLPMEAKDLCNMERTKRFLVGSLVISSILSLPKFFEKGIHEINGWPWQTNAVEKYTFLKVVQYVEENVFSVFKIFFLLFIINVSIILLLKYSHNERIRMTSQSIRDPRTSIMLLAVLFAYVVTHLPRFLLQYDGHWKHYLPSDMYIARNDLSNYFMCCHPLFSFADYLIFSEKYRKSVKSILKRQPSGNSSRKAPQSV